MIEQVEPLVATRASLPSRRAFLVGSSAMLATGVSAQPNRTVRAAFLAQIHRPDPFAPHIFGTLSNSLRQLGYVEGRNLTMEWRFANGDVPSLPRHAAELAAQNPDIIFTAGTLSASAMRKATATIPVVFGNVSDPVSAGLVQSLNRSGTNMTGVASTSIAMIPKLAEVVLEALPKTARLALLVNPQHTAHAGMVASLGPMLERRQVRLLPYSVTNAAEIEQAFTAMARDGADAAIIPLEGLFIQQRRQLGELALKHRLPMVGFDEELAQHGALMTYGTNQHIMFRKMAEFADRVLRGAKPQELPVELPSEFVLVVNRAAEAHLRIQLPQSLLVRADRVI